ncbi:tetratricopeptide repeat protein [Allostella humosa]|nr:hypothetical protein [Stella humosa]
MAAALGLVLAGCQDETTQPVLVPTKSTLEQGQAALRLGDFENAAKMCREATGESNPSPWAFSCLSDAERGLGNKPASEQALQGYLERVPTDVPRRHALARLYLEDGRFPQAQIHLDRVSQLGLATADTFFLVAEIFRLQGNCQAALGNYRQSLRIDPNYGPAHEGQDRARREICPRPAPVRRPPPTRRWPPRRPLPLRHPLPLRLPRLRQHRPPPQRLPADPHPRRHPMRLAWLPFVLLPFVLLAVAAPAHAQGLDLSERGNRPQVAPPPLPASAMIDPACRRRLSGRKVAIVFSEVREDGDRLIRQQRYAGVYPIVADALRRAGMTVFTQEEINRQVAQEELRRFLENQTDAALTAFQRLGPAYVIRANIESRAQMNPMIRVKQVSVTVSFALSSPGRGMMGQADMSQASFTGADPLPVVRDILRERIDGVVADLYASVCAGRG